MVNFLAKIKEGLETGSRILNEVARGGDIGEAVAAQGEEGLRRLVGKAHTKLQKRKTPISEQLQEGEGRRRKKRNKKGIRRRTSKSAIPSGRSRRKSVHWQIGQGKGRKVETWSANGGAKRRGRKRKASEREFLLRPSDVIGKTVMQKALLKRRRLDNLGY